MGVLNRDMSKEVRQAGRNGARGNRESLTEQVYGRIRKEILSCSLKPGDEFTELDIAERFDVSKTPVREALMRLQFESLVRAYPRRGYKVEPIKISDINDIFDMRVIVEAGATELAVQRVTDEELKKLFEIAEATSDEAYDSEPDSTLGANNSFHESIAAASRNVRLHRTLMQMLRELERFFYIEARASVAYPRKYASHTEIVQAMERRDLAAARTAIVDHVEGTRSILLAAVVDSQTRSPLSLL